MSGNPDKKRYPLIDACIAARDLIERLQACCERIEWAGSIRRRKPDVGDIEILFVPAIKETGEKEDLFEPKIVNATEVAIQHLLDRGILTKRLNVEGKETWGQKIKLAVHAPSGIPVDLFRTTHAAWFNYLVCRTGPKSSNERIALAAQAKGWKWKPYTCGFCQLEDGEETQEFHMVGSEEEVFRFVDLPYHEPHLRK